MLDKCGDSALNKLQTPGESVEEFVEKLAAADDAAAISTFVTDTASYWGTMRSLTLVACYRMKELFAGYDTRADAVRATGHSSWTDWLTSIDWPASPATIRTRVLDMTSHRRAGASWATIHGILSNAPTAGHDMIGRVIDTRGRLLSHINEEDLPGGSVEGLMEAIAESPNPGQGRALVDQVSGAPRVYPDMMVVSGGRVYLNVTMERASRSSTYHMVIEANNADGVRVELPPAVYRWIADKLGAQLQT